jgi:hypothetical protein
LHQKVFDLLFRIVDKILVEIVPLEHLTQLENLPVLFVYEVVHFVDSVGNQMGKLRLDDRPDSI